MAGKLILVTGVSGFVAGQVAEQALAAGYQVRGTARGAKAKQFSETVQTPGLEFVQVDDLATDDLSGALKGKEPIPFTTADTHIPLGVDAIVHVASPLPGAASVDDTLDTAVKGTVNVLEAAANAGIRKIVITGTFGSLMEPSLVPGFAGKTFTEADWGSVTVEEVRAKASDPVYVYFASKILAERAVWDFAKDHPQLDIATILPGFIYGPWSKLFPSPSKTGLGTNRFIHALTVGGQAPLIPPVVVDVRDVAKAHVLALGVPGKQSAENRYIVNGGNSTWKEVAELIKTEWPAITTVTPANDVDAIPGVASKLDTTKAEKVLGIDKWITPKQTVLDTVDELLALQESWKDPTL